jgi:hypothetical protein
MSIVGLTHRSDGTAMLRRSVTTKIAIGLPPDANTDHPQQLDHFIFQRKSQRGSGLSAEVIWEIDDEKTARFGKACREVGIILLDDEPDLIFRTEYAWWSKTQKQCWGNGESATRRTAENPRGESWEPCANDGCVDLEDERCRPSGDLYFLLADYPTLGTICKLHTSSYQSIREIYAALEDIRNVTGGRLKGLRLKLFVRAEKNTYIDKKRGGRMSGTKHVLGLELLTSEVKQLMGKTIEALDAFQSVRQQLAGEIVHIDDPEAEQAPAIAAEFYPAANVKPAPAANGHTENRVDPPDDAATRELKERIETAFADLRVTTARRQALLEQHGTDLAGLLDRLSQEIERRRAGEPRVNGSSRGSETAPPTRNSGNSSHRIGPHTGAGRR